MSMTWQVFPSLDPSKINSNSLGSFVRGSNFIAKAFLQSKKSRKSEVNRNNNNKVAPTPTTGQVIPKSIDLIKKNFFDKNQHNYEILKILTLNLKFLTLIKKNIQGDETKKNLKYDFNFKFSNFKRASFP
ncbi:hypothetical protein Glove_141g78 [Diversispora epigaea]|uniref:Uncharacterized protein n=1 Tax=Diversispora epigaea TaxID=1348612 RepID=A0A397IXF3_9GLOM|nr:hypothetical protein Glove_141g78 [Diversispora epigaea]